MLTKLRAAAATGLLSAAAGGCATAQRATPADPQFLNQPLISSIYTADPSAHAFNGRLYLYPSHDIEAGVPEDDLGSHFAMRDYHVFSMERVGAEVTDHGVVLRLEDIPWAGRQLWAPDAAYKDGKYFLYFPAKDKQDIFRIGVAVSDRAEGPFKAEPEPLKGSFSIDPAVFTDTDGQSYMIFGGIWGGQLQRWASGTYEQNGSVTDLKQPDKPALMPKIARMNADMLTFAEAPRDLSIVDEAGKPLLGGDSDRRFFEGSWMHKHQGRYYLSYSTGDTHRLVYAVADNPYGPFTYQGVLLEPVQGWTNHHSIVEHDGKWWLFYHDTQLSGKTHLRNVKVNELNYNPDGSIRTIKPMR
ncbi:Xylosidase/arabinosidase [Cystobacter fuscus DSM 2262]|uniref:Xylosidase/arabinosidase n=1 Tax=Cystobacter fuscus (strain ATCC 25194 / DSM 2262 / NBRC 100088 / M29) TaxID=1242864 RepID=S9P7H2_CYSF2|nr:glycoside hydrolase family 43 protein [Cystobacter fuscus]EPX60400.1 Xylosidase/arabinosidase [Cystobacter fuscus DSM 2262]